MGSEAEKAKNGENIDSMGIKAGELGSRTPQQDEKSPSSRSAEDENQDPLKDWGYKSGEPDYCNGNSDSPMYENGDGDLPSFSIKRLRRLPLRVASDQQPSTLASRTESTGIAVDQNQPDDADGHVTDGNRSESGSAGGHEKVEQKQTLPDPSAHSSGDLPQQEQRLSDLSRGEDDVVAPLGSPPNFLEEDTNPIASPGLQNGDREAEVENGKHAIEDAELRNPGSGIADTSPTPAMTDEPPLERGTQTGNVLGQEISEEKNKDIVVAGLEHALNHPLAGESGNTSDDSHIPNPSPEVEHTALEHSSGLRLQVDNQVRENVSNSPSSSAGLGSVSDKENIKVESSAPVAEDPNREDDGKVSEDMKLVASTSAAEPAELPAPGIVQILPPVMGSRFESPGETTDEETDSPRSSEGFAYPDSDATALPYSGQIMYPSRFSSAQTSNGPSLLQYSGSMSLRSDSSTTSNRSFAFPILAPPEWNSSPVRMAKAHPRRKNRFDGCCFFRLSRIRNKY